MAKPKAPKPKPAPPAKPERKRKERRDWTVPFLADLAENGIVTHAAKAAGISKGTAYDRYGVDAAFRARWDEAVEGAVDDAEVELRRRGVRGGDTTALIFFLKGRRPDVWREPRGAVIVAPNPLTPEQQAYHEIGWQAVMAKRKEIDDAREKQ